MNSIFWDEEVKRTAEVASTGLPPNSKPYHSGSAQVRNGGDLLIEVNIKLYNEAIAAVDFPDTETRLLSLRWKRVEPFVEEWSDSDIFGFKIYGANGNEEFFLETTQELDEWLDQLMPVMICVDIEEDYEFKKTISQGNDARIQNAILHQDEQLYAVKSLYKSNLIKEPKKWVNIIREITIMRMLDHECIVKLYRVYEDDQFIHLVMQLTDEDLFQTIILNDKLSEAVAAKLMFSMLKALNYIHSKGIIHRDIKPENILMSGLNSQNALVADFGLAVIAESSNERYGSPGYIAPEVFRRLYDNKIDIFSMGVVMYVIITGFQPFVGRLGNQEEVLRNNMRGMIIFDPTTTGNMSLTAMDLIKKMTAFNPIERPTAAHCLQHSWFKEFQKSETEQNMVNQIKLCQVPLISDSKVDTSGWNLTETSSLQRKSLKN